MAYDVVGYDHRIPAGDCHPMRPAHSNDVLVHQNSIFCMARNSVLSVCVCKEKRREKKNKRNQSKESTKRSARLISWQHGSIAKKTYYNIICIYVWYSLIIKRVLFGCYTTQQHNNDDILMMLLLSDKWISMWHRLLPYWILCLCIAFARQQIKYPLSQQQKKKEKNIWE